MSAATGAFSSSTMTGRSARYRMWVGVLVFVVVGTVVALGVYLVQAVQWARYPRLVGLIGPTQVVDAEELIFSSPWDGTEAGFDVILKMDDGLAAPLVLSSDPRFAQSQVRNYANWEAEREVTLTVRRHVNSAYKWERLPDGFDCAGPKPESFPAEVECVFKMVVDYLPLDVLITWFVIPYVVGVIFLVIGLVVLWRRYRQTSARLFTVLCAAMALSLAGLFDNYSTHALIWLWPASVALAGGMLGVFTLAFPSDLDRVRRYPWLRWMPPILAALMALYSILTLYSENKRAYYDGWQLCCAFAAVNLVAFIGISLWRRIRTASFTVREQSGMVLVGGFFAFVPLFLIVVNNVLESQFAARPIPLSMAAAVPFMLAFPLTLGYAIVQRYGLGTDRLISRTTVYSLLGISTILGYALITAGASAILADRVSADSPVLVALVVTVVAFALAPVRNALERLVNRVYFRTRYAYQQALETFGRKLTRAVEPEEVVEVIRATLEEALLPGCIYVYMLDSDTNHYTARGDHASDGDTRFECKGGVAQTLDSQRNIVYLSAESNVPPELITDVARLRVLQVVLLAALKGKGREQLTGFIALGAKRSGEPYVHEDLRFVESLVEQASLAVERSQVVADLSRRLGDLDALSKVAQAVNFTIEFDDLLELIYAQASRVIDTSNFFIALYDPEASELYYAFYSQNDERDKTREGERWKLGRGLISEVVRLGQPIRTEDYMTECAKRDIRPRERGLRAWMGIPMNAGTGTLGAIAVASTTPGFMYTDEQYRVFWSIADAAATAIDKSRLFTETEKRARQLSVLNEISNRLSQELDVEALLRLIVNSAVEILRAETGSLLLTESETGDLVFSVAIGASSQHLIGERLPRGTGVVGTVAERGEAVIVNDVRHDPRWYGGLDQSLEFETKAVLAVPLVAQNAVIGVLELINKDDGSIFTQEDEQLLTTFAAQAAVAIQNVRLFRQTDEELASRNRELEMLARIDRDLNVGLEFNRIIDLTLHWSMRVSGANAGAIGLVEKEGLLIIKHYGYGAEIGSTFARPLPLDSGISGRVIAGGKPELVQRVGMDPDYLPISLDTKSEMVVPLRSGGEVVGVIILDSYTAGTLTEEALNSVVRVAEHASPAITNARLYADLQTANQAKSDFVGLVSHELKNPMTAVGGFTDMLMKGGVGEVSAAQQRFLATILSNVERMKTLVSDLEDITAIETGKLKLAYKSVTLRAMIDETLTITQHMIDRKGQNLQLNIPEDLPPIYADRNRVVQVLTNLVSNASKYTDEGGAVTIGAAVARNVWDPDGPPEIMHVYVRDTGRGMSEEVQAKLFQKFYRDPEVKESDIPGTGLGLNITKTLVELHGGKIWVNSKVDEGSIFHFTVPLAK
ncbi:MAG: GAF domain-containing protein [Anaerolineae bacterium]|nr:GAF domain-containing protein [Anaerolineae bacterium]